MAPRALVTAIRKGDASSPQPGSGKSAWEEATSATVRFPATQSMYTASFPIHTSGTDSPCSTCTENWSLDVTENLTVTLNYECPCTSAVAAEREPRVVVRAVGGRLADPQLTRQR